MSTIASTLAAPCGAALAIPEDKGNIIGFATATGRMPTRDMRSDGQVVPGGDHADDRRRDGAGDDRDEDPGLRIGKAAMAMSILHQISGISYMMGAGHATADSAEVVIDLKRQIIEMMK